MKLKHQLLITLASFAMLPGCKKSGEKPSAIDVYTAGYVVAANTHSVAAYWKNGTLVRLADSTFSSTANAIAVVGNDVYVVGNITNSEQITIAVIWKNGAMTKLNEDASNSSDARAIAISGSDVYVAGFINNLTATYWKNGVATTLASGAVANAISVEGGNVYTAGFLFDTSISNNETVYWKNGTATELVVPTPGNAYDYISGNASAISASGSGIYVTGYAGGGKYWKNGTEVDLYNGYYCYPSAIAVNGSDVYIAGITDGAGPAYIPTATYWQNGRAVPLTGSSISSYGYSIALNGADVYVGGAANGSAVYWKNEAEVELAPNGAVYSIALVKH